MSERFARPTLRDPWACVRHYAPHLTALWTADVQEIGVREATVAATLPHAVHAGGTKRGSCRRSSDEGGSVPAGSFGILETIR